MKTRRLIVALYGLVLSLGAVGCGSGIKEGMPENLTPSADFLKQEEAIGKLNMSVMKK
jgi:hypothetical protein